MQQLKFHEARSLASQDKGPPNPWAERIPENRDGANEAMPPKPIG